jgi:hypothetical protein
LQKYIEDPLSEELIQGTITTRPAFIEVFLEDNKLFYRLVSVGRRDQPTMFGLSRSYSARAYDLVREVCGPRRSLWQCFGSVETDMNSINRTSTAARMLMACTAW